MAKTFQENTQFFHDVPQELIEKMFQDFLDSSYPGIAITFKRIEDYRGFFMAAVDLLESNPVFSDDIDVQTGKKEEDRTLFFINLNDSFNHTMWELTAEKWKEYEWKYPFPIVEFNRLPATKRGYKKLLEYNFF